MLLVVSLYLVPAQAINLWQLRQHPDNRLAIYTEVGKWLRDNTPPDASIGTLEVGVIGFYAQRIMIDFAGLIRPQVSNQLTTHTTYEDAALWAVEYYHPDYLVLTRTTFFRAWNKNTLSSTVKRFNVFRGMMYGYSTDLNVYVCK